MTAGKPFFVCDETECKAPHLDCRACKYGHPMNESEMRQWMDTRVGASAYDASELEGRDPSDEDSTEEGSETLQEEND